jgi:hypothetical protein
VCARFLSDNDRRLSRYFFLSILPNKPDNPTSLLTGLFSMCGWYWRLLILQERFQDLARRNVPGSLPPPLKMWNCRDGTFSDGARCLACSPICRSCVDPTPNDCTVCAEGTYFFNGACVAVDGDGVCHGTNGLVANNIEYACDSTSSLSCSHSVVTSVSGCGAKCAECKIPNFGPQSTMDEIQCTRCLPGSFLFEGKCVASCSTGTSPSQDNTCTSKKSSFFPLQLTQLAQRLVQIVPRRAVLVPAPPISALHAEAVKSCPRADASPPALQIHFLLPVPVLNVIPTAPPVPEHPSTSASPAHRTAPSSLMGGVYPHAPNLNILTLHRRHAKLVIPAAHRVPGQGQWTVSHVPV